VPSAEDYFALVLMVRTNGTRSKGHSALETGTSDGSLFSSTRARGGRGVKIAHPTSLTGGIYLRCGVSHFRAGPPPYDTIIGSLGRSTQRVRTAGGSGPPQRRTSTLTQGYSTSRATSALAFHASRTPEVSTCRGQAAGRLGTRRRSCHPARIELQLDVSPFVLTNCSRPAMRLEISRTVSLHGPSPPARRPAWALLHQQHHCWVVNGTP